mgnify:CR=1 FL=1
MRGHRLVFADDGLILAKDIYSVNSRNISGIDPLGQFDITVGLISNLSKDSVKGAFRGSKKLTQQGEEIAVPKHNTSNYNNGMGVSFNANSGEKEDNPMVGHAEGIDIHPYSLYLVPLITY